MNAGRIRKTSRKDDNDYVLEDDDRFDSLVNTALAKPLAVDRAFDQQIASYLADVYSLTVFPLLVQQHFGGLVSHVFNYPIGFGDDMSVRGHVKSNGVYIRMKISIPDVDDNLLWRKHHGSISLVFSPLGFRPPGSFVNQVPKFSDIFAVFDEKDPNNSFVRNDQHSAYQVVKRWDFEYMPRFKEKMGRYETFNKDHFFPWEGLVGVQPTELNAVVGPHPLPEGPADSDFHVWHGDGRDSLYISDYVNLNGRISDRDNDPIGFDVTHFKKGLYYLTFTSSQLQQLFVTDGDPSPPTASMGQVEVNMRWHFKDLQ